MISAVTVFCGSSNAVDAKYFAAARELGEKLAKRGWRLIYGGGGVGHGHLLLQLLPRVLPRAAPEPLGEPRHAHPGQ